MGQTKSISLRQPRAVTRTGVAADCATQHTVDMFTVTGVVLLVGIFGRVMFVKDAGAQLLRLGHVPTIGAVEAFLCAASATTATDAAETIYTIDGVVTDAMIVAPAALGVGLIQVNAAGLVGVPHGLILVPGILRLTTSVANDITGLINWTAIYQAMSLDASMTVL